MPDEDPSISAVVTILPVDQRTTETPASGIPLSDDLRAVGLAKSRFSSAGFEIHAPFTNSFSIGAKQSVFSEFFKDEVIVDDTQLVRRVTASDGSYELPLNGLPDELKGLVKSVEFVSAPDFLSFK